ncbi:DNA-binding protein [Burkholderia pseudomallei]|nr:DNA-binding protein [Burkholderia pseudomallei]RIV65472.1 DNA-binding protein [Burkholderia pseudomallei]
MTEFRQNPQSPICAAYASPTSGAGAVSASTVDLLGAAAMLGAHPETVRLKAKAGALPGRKVGKRWMFSTVALQRYLAGEWIPRVVQGDPQEKLKSCRSINAVTVPTGITASPRLAVVRSYKAALAPVTKPRRRSCTIG